MREYVTPKITEPLCPNCTLFGSPQQGSPRTLGLRDNLKLPKLLILHVRTLRSSNRLCLASENSSGTARSRR